MSEVTRLVDATPASRDRYADFLRVASLIGVMIGHFLMAVVVWSPAVPGVSFTNILAIEPLTRWATLALQVMPVFFVVGGFAHAATLDSLARNGGGYADFVISRITRLVRPALVYIGTWMVLGAVVDAIPGTDERFGAVLQILGQLLWFIGIYLIAAAFAPLLLRAHRRFGIRALVALVVAIVAVDAARLALGVEPVKWLNFAFVWLAIHQLGYFYADGVAHRVGARRLGAWMLVGGALVLAALVGLGPYGVAMVSYEGEELSNLAPPTIALFAFAVAQAGALLLAREGLGVWLSRRRVWAGVIVGGSVAMTAFLWHFTALVAAYGLAWWLGPETSPAGGSAQWWLSKALLFVPFAALVGGLVWGLRRFDRAGRRRPLVGPSTGRALVAAVGVACAVVGMIGFAAVGFRGVLHLYTVTVAGVPLSAVASAVLVFASATLTAIAVRAPSRSST